jgi:DNA primase
LKLLQSEGVLTIASTGKDETTGNLVTKEYRVEGPVMLLLTTTAIDIDEELLNRCLVLTVNETREQTQAIHRLQREKRTLDGLLARASRDDLRRVHRNAQKLLKPLSVMNPYAGHLTFTDQVTRTRRDHEKYLTLIDTIALLHQHQREIKTVEHGGRLLQYIEVTLDDIAIANELAHEILGRTLDELPPQTRRLLKLLHPMVRHYCTQDRIEQKQYRFSRKTVRLYTGWGNTQLKVHLARLEDLEYIISHGGGRGSLIRYELQYQGEGEDGESFLPGLIDVEHLKYHYDKKKSGVNDEKSGANDKKAGSSRPQVGGMSGGGRDRKNPSAPLKEVLLKENHQNNANDTSDEDATSRSHVVEPKKKKDVAG